jgi:hypothetical protein
MKEFSKTRAIPYHHNYELHVMLIPLCTLFPELVVVLNKVTPHLKKSKSCALPKLAPSIVFFDVCGSYHMSAHVDIYKMGENCSSNWYSKVALTYY